MLDKRLNAYREDLADEGLRAKVSARKFVQGKVAQIATPFADLYSKPDLNAGLASQVLYGHDVLVFERKNGWAWVQAAMDGYVGYVQESVLSDKVVSPTHMVLAPRTFFYSKADLKSPRCGYRSVGSRLEVAKTAETRGTEYAILSSGEAVIAKHLIVLGEWMNDPVAVAETLLHTPYLWGGSTGFGMDCSGLVQTSQMLCGNTVLRDSDMQAATIGQQIEFDPLILSRGDLVFWKGHVGMMADNENLLHANGHTMNVAFEPLNQAVERIGYLYGQPTSVRRP